MILFSYKMTYSHYYIKIKNTQLFSPFNISIVKTLNIIYPNNFMLLNLLEYFLIEIDKYLPNVIKTKFISQKYNVISVNTYLINIRFLKKYFFVTICYK